MKRWFVRLFASLLLIAVTTPLFAQDLASYEKRVTVKTLPNGLTVLIWQRPEAPVFSFFTMVDAGSAQDPRNRDRSGAHDGAHGLQGHSRHRHYELRR